METWKDIKNYEGYYQVSNCGRVRSVDRKVLYKSGHVASHKGRVKKISNKTEYRVALLSKNNKQKLFKVSRLVAQAFIDNPHRYSVVNHRDGNKHNDCVENLEWTTTSKNAIHAFENGLSFKKNRVAGVFYEQRRKKWASYLYRDNKNIFIGRYKTFKQAKNAQSLYKASLDK